MAAVPRSRAPSATPSALEAVRADDREGESAGEGGRGVATWAATLFDSSVGLMLFIECVWTCGGGGLYLLGGDD